MVSAMILNPAIDGSLSTDFLARHCVIYEDFCITDLTVGRFATVGFRIVKYF